jgi:predicted alpha/beta-hydrolase family hydrolase
MTIYPAAGDEAPLLLLAHGAGAGQQHPWMRRVAAGLASRGVTTATFDFGYMAARRKVPDPPAVLEAAFRDAYQTLLVLQGRSAGVFVGGKSMGGRIASQVVARGDLLPAPAGLVCFGYPLHPPGKPHQRRDGHLPSLRLPVLLVHGSADPFGTREEMTALAFGLQATLHVVEGGDHSLSGGKRADPHGRLLEDALDAAASWIRSRGVPV